MELIDKSALVAEIEKQIELGKLKCQQSQKNNDYVSHVAWSEHIATCGKMLSFINSIEVKEVDLKKHQKENINLEKEVNQYFEKTWPFEEDDKGMQAVATYQAKENAKKRKEITNDK